MDDNDQQPPSRSAERRKMRNRVRKGNKRRQAQEKTKLEGEEDTSDRERESDRWESDENEMSTHEFLAFHLKRYRETESKEKEEEREKLSLLSGKEKRKMRNSIRKRNKRREKGNEKSKKEGIVSLSDALSPLVEEKVWFETEEHFDDWKFQLFQACGDDRVGDVDAILSSRLPSHVSVRRTEWKVTKNYWNENREGEYKMQLFSWEEFHDKGYSVPPLPKKSDLPSLLRSHISFSGSSLFWAKSVECLKTLLQHGAQLDDQGWMGAPLLLHHADQNNYDIVLYLLEELSADPNEPRLDGGYRPLHWAKSEKVMKALIDHGAKVDSLTLQRVSSRNLENFKYLCSLEGVDVPPDAFASCELSYDMIEFLVEHGADVNQPVNSPFGVIGEMFLLHKILIDNFNDYRRETLEEGKKEIGHETIRLTKLLLQSGFEAGVLHDCNGDLCIHIVKKNKNVIDEWFFDSLISLLQPYDGERGEVTRLHCTCGY